MTRLLRWALPVLTAGVVLAHTGCGSKSSDHAPTGPTGRGGPLPEAVDGGQARAMAVAPPLGAAGSFAVLGGSTVTNTGPTVVNGDLGVSPGSAVTGFPPGVVTGTIHAADATALSAQNSATTVFNALASQA